MPESVGISWRERCTELMADRDYWRSRAETWETRCVDAHRELTAHRADPVADTTDRDIPAALEIALSRYAIGQPKDMARTMRREVIEAFGRAPGSADQRISAALARLHHGDSDRLAAFLGEES